MNFKTTALMTIFLTCNIFLTAENVHAGVKEGGGGIIISAEFATTGRAALGFLSEGDSNFNLNEILEKIRDVKVVPVNEICFIEPVLKTKYCEDAHYDAKNNLVLLNFNRWDQITCTERLVLSTHEFLRASGMETEGYEYSGRFFSGNVAACKNKLGSDVEQLKCSDLVVTLANQIGRLCARLDAYTEDRRQAARQK